MKPKTRESAPLFKRLDGLLSLGLAGPDQAVVGSMYLQHHITDNDIAQQFTHRYQNKKPVQANP